MWPYSRRILDWHAKCPQNPQTFSQHIVYRMHKDHNPLHVEMEDKYAARGIVESKNACRLPKLYHWTTTLPVRLPWDELPKRCVIKTNHWSGDGLFIIDEEEESLLDISNIASIPEIYRIIRGGKDQFGVKWSHRKMERKLGRLVKRHFPRPIEWATQQIEPRGVMVEELLIDGEGQLPPDYKMHCFHGKVGFIQADFDRFSNHTQNIHLVDGSRINQTNPKIAPATHISNLVDVIGNESLTELVKAAELLSEDIDHVRVDFFLVNGEVVFGEFTTYHHSGHPQSKEWDELGGKLWSKLTK